ncbi:low-density lipoprotein receptor-related protein 6-like isoform X2, partial [Argonauta hians]
EECNGLAVNWVTNHLYWTDAKTGRIEMSNYDGSGRRILFGSEMDQPRGIIVDPMSGYIFWADQGLKQIERAQLNGNKRRLLIDTDLHWPNQLAISPATRRLYWVDGMNHMIMSCDMNGKNIKLERNTTEKTGSNVIFGLALSGNRAIISVWFQAKLYSTLVAAAAASWKVESEKIGENELFSIIVVDGSVQATVYQHPCSRPDNGGCSHLCMPKGGVRYQCVCPSFGGLALSKDRKTCQVPDNLLFYTLTGTGQVGFHAIDWPVTPYLTLVGWSSNPSAITYDPIEKTVYWSDVTEYTIYSSNLDGSNRNIFLNASHGIAIVDGLAIDWLQRRLYFTNLGLSFHGVDGSTCFSHTIEMISLDGRIRKTIIADLEKPRGLTIDNQNGYLYYTDWGTEPKVARTFLDGSEIEILKTEDLSSPNGLTVDNGQLYVTDSNYQNKTLGPQIWLFNMATNKWNQVSVTTDLKLPRGISHQDDILYYTDWSSEDDTDGFIFQLNLKKSSLSKNPLVTGMKPTGLYYSPRQIISSEPDATCDNAACSDECIRTPADYSSERFHCSCPDTYNLILSTDKAICKEPDNFLIVADLNTLKLKALDDHLDSNVHILHYGHADSSYVALVYNDPDKTLFWSDLRDGRQTIMYSHLEKTEPKILVQVNHSIDCLALDQKHQKLYWTGYNNITGFIAEINLKHTNKPYKQLLVNLDAPRAVTIHSDKNIIFWSEYGLKSGKAGVYRCHTNCHRQKTVMAEKLQWPNSLVIYRNELYVADGFHGRIYAMDFKGGKRRELLYLSKNMDHIFGLQIYEHLLFYSRWYEPSVHMVDMITGKDEIFLDHLTQPTAIVVHHPSNINESSFCNTDKNDCKGMCVPVPHNYHCTCDPGYQLIDEKCIKLENPWEQSDEAMCPEGCPDHSFCARLIPTLHYECVCAAGFQGNGGACKECPNNTYKSEIGNSSCLPCPNDSDSQHISASKACLCKSSSARLVGGICEETESTSTSRPTSTVTTSTITTTTSSSTSTLPTTITTTTMSTTTEPVITTRKKAANIGLPKFENCPDGDTITVALPTQENSVFVAVTWSATDHLDKQLVLESNIPYNKDGLHFKWLGKFERQKVIFTAVDRWNQKAVCEFYVIVEDREAPHFTYCPHNIVIKTNLFSERVIWPKPVAEDNTQLEEVVSSHKIGSDFTSGTTIVNYTAMDKSGNNVTCNFSVTIIPETNCNLPKITNGRFVCGTDPPQLAMCYITCESKFGVNPLGVFNEPFNCKVLDNIHKLEEIMKTQKPCLNNHHPFKVQQEFEIQFQGRCEQDDSNLHSKLSSAVTQYLDAQNHCWDVKCNFNNITVLCGPKTGGHRYKRSNYFTVTWNITINNVQRLPKSDIREILEAFEQELAYVAELFSINVHDREYKSVPGSVKASAPYWQCKSGEMLQDEYCIPCPPGSMLNVTSQRCSFCMVGFYQEEEGQTSCKLCPDGVSTAEGATSLDYCISIPAIDEMSKFLIITTCTFGFVFLCLVVFMYLQYQRQQRKASNLKAAPTPRNTTTSVYVAPPPFPRVKPVNGSFETRDYMYVHEYEDIENASQVSKMPNPNIDALYRIPPHMQRRLASTENIYDD